MFVAFRRVARIVPFLAFVAAASAQDALVPLGGVDAVSMGFASTCALADDGQVLCWGRNTEGQLGIGSEFPRATAVPVQGLPGPATAVASGRLHVCAIVGGEVWCWGRNFYGEIGDGTVVSRVSPVRVLGIAGGATALALGDLHSCAIVDGGVRCWGNNVYGQLGDGTGVDATFAVPVGALASGVTQIVAGALHTCALQGGAMKCWGANYDRQIGDPAAGDTVLEPAQVDGLASGVVAMAVGTAHTCAIVGAGAVRCWGNNERYQLAVDDVGSSDVPIDATGVGAAALAITAGA
ncbi:MAG TPA: hypothetical protein VJ724_06115, partial [Tahibacter sp.]|nr:hypothetical protein [Tahibacter sp.]